MTAVVAVGEIVLVALAIGLLVLMPAPRKALVPVRADRIRRRRVSRRQ